MNESKSPGLCSDFAAMTLKISKLSKRYNDKWVLRDVSLEIERGQILGLAGHNAAGRSTLLKILYGGEKATTGEVTFEGRPFSDALLVASSPARNRWSLFGKAAGSDSERQTANFTDAIEAASAVLLLDNALSLLDHSQKLELQEKLRTAVREKNLVAVITTCDDAEMFAVCDRIAVLANGEVAQVGTPREIYENPNSVAVARSLGCCNLITARRVTFNNQASLEFHTLTGEHRLQVDKTDKATLGAITNNVTLAIRPEHISISFGASFPEDNLLKAEITGIHYEGATTRLKLMANGLVLEALVLRLVGLNLGDQCMVGLPPDRIAVLKS
jgi:putative spermidine/putrescine transport system ATP-binding protein